MEMVGKAGPQSSHSFKTILSTIQKTCSLSENSAVWADVSQLLRILLLITFVLSLMVAQPAVAQNSNPVCQDESNTLTNMIEGFVQLTTALGLVGLLVVWQADELAEMFTLSQEQTARLKQHKVNAMKSATVLVLLGPLFTIAGNTMDLPIAQCVDLIPL